MRGAFLQKGRGEVSLPLTLGRPWDGERVSGVGEGEWEMRWKMKWKSILQILEKCPKFKYFGLI